MTRDLQRGSVGNCTDEKQMKGGQLVKRQTRGDNEANKGRSVGQMKQVKRRSIPGSSSSNTVTDNFEMASEENL